MKTAEKYWNGFAEAAGWCGCDYLTDKQKKEFTNLVAAIRADALAEKPAAPDADEERAKREWDRMRGGDSRIFYPYDACNQAEQAAIRTLFAALPPRPMRSPGQVLFDAEKANGFWHYANWNDVGTDTLAKLEAAATALGIQSQE